MGKLLTKEAPNQIEYDDFTIRGPYRMGAWSSWLYRSDPKHLVFTLSRYKFVAKMLSGKTAALEVGGGDAFGAPIVLQEVSTVHLVDFEPIVINNASDYFDKELLKRISFEQLDITEQIPKGESYDCVYSLDVLEHIPNYLESKFIENSIAKLNKNGVMIVGTPNVEASRFSTGPALEAHINLKSASDLNSLMQNYFENVFIFSMNDEVVHTGFTPMAHYLLAIAVGKKE